MVEGSFPRMCVFPCCLTYALIGSPLPFAGVHQILNCKNAKSGFFVFFVSSSNLLFHFPDGNAYRKVEIAKSGIPEPGALVRNRIPNPNPQAGWLVLNPKPWTLRLAG